MSNKRIINGAKKVVNDCLNIKTGENLAIVADLPNSNVAHAFAEAGKDRGAFVSILQFFPLQRHSQDPPMPIIEGLCKADAAILAAIFSLSSSKARQKATNGGTRIISIPGCSEELFKSPAINVNFNEQKKLIERLGNLLRDTFVINITSGLGTNVRAKIRGQKIVPQTALARTPGSWAPFPNIEIAVGPSLDGVEGVLFVDGAIIPGGQIKNPVRIEIEKGTIVSITGGKEAKDFKKLLADYNDPNMYKVVEIGIGLNPKAKIGRGFMAEDESQFGTLHLGIGEGSTFGVPISAVSHADLVIRKPTILFDETVIFEKEKLII